MQHTGFFKTNVENKCDRCSYYTPVVKNYTNLGKVEMCHGACNLNHKYRSRTDTCRKFKSK